LRIIRAELRQDVGSYDNYSFIEVNRRLRQLHPGIVNDAVHALEEHGGRHR